MPTDKDLLNILRSVVEAVMEPYEKDDTSTVAHAKTWHALRKVEVALMKLVEEGDEHVS